jgi:hypothetical protein
VVVIRIALTEEGVGEREYCMVGVSSVAAEGGAPPGRGGGGYWRVYWLKCRYRTLPNTIKNIDFFCFLF